jgi:hypothetical protein
MHEAEGKKRANGERKVYATFFFVRILSVDNVDL